MPKTRPRRWARDPAVRWPWLEQTLQCHAGALARQGGLCSRLAGDRRVWSVRFVEVVAGRRRRRAVYVGDDRLLLRRVRSLLALYRDEQRWVEDASGLSRVLARLADLTRPGGRP